MSNYCMCCYQELGENDLNCPRCGLTDLKIIGNDPEQEKALEPFIRSHRMGFLRKYELGVTCYYWKDQDGTIALDSKRTLTFGNAAELLEGTRWLDQEFARMPDDQEITVDLTVTENGFGKRTALPEYLRTGPDGEKIPQQRGGKGLKNYNITPKTGKVAGCCLVAENDDVMLIENGGVIIRTPAKDINVYKRDVQGVIVMRVEEGNQLMGVQRVARTEEEAE